MTRGDREGRAPPDLEQLAETDTTPPNLDATVIDDDEAVGSSVLRIVAADADLNKRGVEIADFVAVLHPMLTDQEADLLCRVIGLSEVRHEASLIVVARWAFGEGRREGSGVP